MADYLWRVVAAEMPASFESEALKAQAVAARTYAEVKMAAAVANHPDADVFTDINCCQAYIEPAAAAANWVENADAYTEKIKAAVSGTDGMVALYDGAPIQAVFFSSAAGRTVDAVEVWGNSVPYLTSVESPEGDEVPGYHSTVPVPLETSKAPSWPRPRTPISRRRLRLALQHCPQQRRRCGKSRCRRRHDERRDGPHPLRPALGQISP